MLGLANNTVAVYGRGLEDFFRWCAGALVRGCAGALVRWCAGSRGNAGSAGREDVALYVADLRQRRGPRGERVIALESGAGLSNATIQQRFIAVRLFFDFLMEEGIRDTNPVGRGRYTPAKGFGAFRALVKAMRKTGQTGWAVSRT